MRRNMSETDEDDEADKISTTPCSKLQRSQMTLKSDPYGFKSAMDKKETVPPTEKVTAAPRRQVRTPSPHPLKKLAISDSDNEEYKAELNRPRDEISTESFEIHSRSLNSAPMLAKRPPDAKPRTKLARIPITPTHSPTALNREYSAPNRRPETKPRLKSSNSNHLTVRRRAHQSANSDSNNIKTADISVCKFLTINCSSDDEEEDSTVSQKTEPVTQTKRNPVTVKATGLPRKRSYQNVSQV
jgi:hypothetical protein